MSNEQELIRRQFFSLYSEEEKLILVWFDLLKILSA